MKADRILGQILDGKYKIDKQLGKGGMGTVYLSTHIGTGRPVAVKVIAPDFMKREEFVERFRREARAAGKLRHPNVVDVTDFGFSSVESGEDVAYLVMEYLDGCTLGEVLDEEKKLPVQFTIDILEQVCSAVEEAHNRGIIHRDLKPDNIWLEPNQRGGYTVKVLDFGIAKLEESQLLDADEIIQTPSKSGQQTELINEKQTIAENDQPATLLDSKSSTVIGENETVAIVEEAKTMVAESNPEAGTVIQPSESNSSESVDSEGGTAILPTNQTQTFDNEEADAKGTRLISENDLEDSKGTKVISGKGATDKSLLSTPVTTNLTRVGAVLGTPLYMSPEQCRGEKLTARSDIYSLAVIAYQMLSGKLPFTGDYVKVMKGHKNEEPPQLKAKKVPAKLKEIVMQSLAKEPESRPETAEAFASKLRSNSEGIGVLLRRAIIIYSERMPKFLGLAALTFLPLILITLMRVTFSFLVGFGVIESSNSTAVVGFSFSIVTFFVHIVSAAFLVGMTTWVVAQTLAYPLKPISLKAAFVEVKKRWKPLTITVTISTLLALASWGVGFVGLPISLAYIITFFAALINGGIAIVAGISLAVIGAIVFGAFISTIFMLIAPSIIMEDVSGTRAFNRSISLVQRSFRTVFATALLVYIVPALLAMIMAFSIGSIIGNIDKSREIERMKKEGVVAEKKEDKKEEGESINFSVNSGRGVEIKTGEDSKSKTKEEKSMRRRIQRSLTDGIFELVWTPLALLIASFTSVITALIYFKTRQAGGESMQELLGKLDDSEHIESKWQQRVRERLIQSGKITGNTRNSGKSKVEE